MYTHNLNELHIGKESDVLGTHLQNLVKQMKANKINAM
jgi:hypothetical protein